MKKLKATGYYGKDIFGREGWQVNYSSILSELIKCAGRYCERYSSDLFIEWEGVVNLLREAETISRTLIFGFRESGVDEVTDCRVSTGYYKMMKLEIKTVQDYIYMELTDITETSEYEIIKKEERL